MRSKYLAIMIAKVNSENVTFTKELMITDREKVIKCMIDLSGVSEKDIVSLLLVENGPQGPRLVEQWHGTLTIDLG